MQPVEKEVLFMNPAQVVWVVLMVVFLAVEAITPGLTSIWFGLGALVALVSAFVGAPVWLQAVLFFVVSIVALVLTRPLARKFVNKRVQATNADKVIGSQATVTERVDNIAGTGAASVGGRIWTARSAGGDVIEAGELTTVKSIEGVKLLLVPQPVHAIEK